MSPILLLSLNQVGSYGVAIAPISARSLWSHAETLARLMPRSLSPTLPLVNNCLRHPRLHLSFAPLARLPPRSLNKDGLNKEGGEEKLDNIRRIIRLALFALAPNCFRRVALLFALLILSLRSHGFRHARSRPRSLWLIIV